MPLASALAAASMLRVSEMSHAVAVGRRRRRLPNRIQTLLSATPPASCADASPVASGPDATIGRTGMSSITKHRLNAAVSLGGQIKRLRQARGMTQSELGRPLTRAFISAIEHGRCLPSLAVSAMFASRLDVSLDELLEPVKRDLASLYTDRDAEGSDLAIDGA